MGRRDAQAEPVPALGGADVQRAAPRHTRAAAPPRSAQAWSPQAQLATIAVVLLASYNVSFLVHGASRLLAWLRGTQSILETQYGGVPYPTLTTYTPRDLPTWEGPKAPQPREQVPVVMYYGRPGEVPCHKGHLAYATLVQAQRHNEQVFFIGPRECRQIWYTLGIAFEEYAEYEEVYEWFVRNVGSPVHVHVRWFILKAFMERHGYSRVLSINPEVLLFANVTEVAAWMFPTSHMVLPVRWPSLRPPARPYQYPSVTVSTHAALVSYVGLTDWCLFLLGFFRLSLFGGDLESENVPLMPAYSDTVIMGWYTFPECWETTLDPPCLGEPEREMTPELGKVLLANRLRPKYRVHSFSQPRVCHNSSWSDEGLCVWDHDFSVRGKAPPRFHFPRGAKCPTSKKYVFYDAWVGEQQREPVQFLAVHFHSRGKESLAGSVDPLAVGAAWGSARS